MSSLRDSAFELFLEEAAEHLATLESGLLRLEQEPADGAGLEALFRAAHTLKGSAALMKRPLVSTLAHRLEDILEDLQLRQAVPSREQTDGLLFALDRLRELTAQPDELLGAPLLAAAEARLALPLLPVPPAAGQTAPLPPPRRPPPREEGGGVRVAAEKIEGVMNVLGQMTVIQTYLMNQLGTVERLRDEIGFSGGRLLREVGQFAERHAYTSPLQKGAEDHLLSEFQELEFDRYDEINLFARKLQEITSDISEEMRIVGEFFSRFQGEVEGMDRLTREMKERLSEVRTVQAGLLFQRFTRTVRDLSRQAGRPIELIVSGAETLIDRAIYDGLYEPLLHIVRNAVAHGIEAEEARRALGKPPAGRLWLGARRLGNTVEIEVRDDGRGLQYARIRQRAVEKGLLAVDAEPSERELLQLIFRPGFSTTETADADSGRGVGMSVVLDRLAALNGTLDIDSRPDEGTTMRLRLPLSLVVVNVVQFELAGQPFVIPSTLVSELTDLPATTQLPKQLDLRGEPVPTVDLHRVLGLAPAAHPPRFAIFTRASGGLAALLVDALLSQEDAVIRPFDSLLRELPHFAGTSVAGDGTLRLVLNPVRLLDPGGPVAAPAPPPVAAPRPPGLLTVLVVDDSLSVRRYASLALEARDLRVLTAANGLEALELLDREPVDFVFTDLEMPLMHGYELLRELRRRGRLATLPVAVLSSRAGEAHRAKAMALGACDYLVKPFDEGALAETVHRHKG